MSVKFGKSHNGKNKGKLKRLFLPKKDEELGDRLFIANVAASFRNVVYDTMEDRGLSAGEISILFYGYLNVFFSKSALIEQTRVGAGGIYKNINNLLEKGYIDEYSPLQYLEEDVEVYSELLERSYIERKEVAVEAKYKLAKKGSFLVGKMLDKLSSGEFVRCKEYATRSSKTDNLNYMRILPKKDKSE